jgi:hypothetical protein
MRTKATVALLLAVLSAISILLAATRDADAAKTPIRQRLAVAWTDTNGRGAVVAFRAKPPFNTVTDVLPVDPAPQLRFANGLLYAISRSAGTITVINPRRWIILRIFQLGANSEPIDIAPVNTRTAYVTRANAKSLLKLNLRTGETAEAVDFTRLAGADGIPDFGTMVRQGKRLFVQLRRLSDEGFEPPAAVAVVDTETDEIIDADRFTPGPQAIALQGTSPKHDMQLVRRKHMLIVNASGGFFDEGGIERIDLETLSSQGLVIREADDETGADLGAVLLTCRSSGFLTYSTDLLLSSHLHRFSFGGGTAPAELSVSLDYEAPVIEHATRQRRLFVPRADGIGVFDSSTGLPLLGVPIATPAPPSDIVLLRATAKRTSSCP